MDEELESRGVEISFVASNVGYHASINHEGEGLLEDQSFASGGAPESASAPVFPSVLWRGIVSALPHVNAHLATRGYRVVLELNQEERGVFVSGVGIQIIHAVVKRIVNGVCAEPVRKDDE